MKKALIIFALFLMSFKSNVIMHKNLESHVITFVEEAQKRGINGYQVVMQLKEIVYVENIQYFPVPKETLALYDSQENAIYIDKKVKKYSKNAQLFIVFHELGHAMGKVDIPYGIMAEALTIDQMETLVKDEWQEQLDVFFDITSNSITFKD